MGPYQVPLRRARVDLETMAMKGCSVFPKAPALLEPHHQIVSCHIRTLVWAEAFTLLQRCSRCILQPQPTGQCDRGLIVVLYSVFKSETKKNITLLLVELIAITWISCISRCPYIITYIETLDTSHYNKESNSQRKGIL